MPRSRFVTSGLALALLTPFNRAAIDSGAPAAHVVSKTIGGGSLLVQLRPLVGMPKEAAVAAVIRGPHATKIRRLTPGMPARFPYSAPEGSLVVLVTQRVGETNELGEPIAILDQACCESPSPRLAPPAVRHAAVTRCSRYRCDASATCAAAASAGEWLRLPPGDLVARCCALDLGIPLPVRRSALVRLQARPFVRQRGRGDASVRRGSSCDSAWPGPKSVGPTALGAREGGCGLMAMDRSTVLCHSHDLPTQE